MIPVKFLIEKDNNVFAFFPTEKYNAQKTLFTSYETIGQHSACCVLYANECIEATKHQYKKLKKELITIGYNNLRILNSEK